MFYTIQTYNTGLIYNNIQVSRIYIYVYNVGTYAHHI